MRSPKEWVYIGNRPKETQRLRPDSLKKQYNKMKTCSKQIYDTELWKGITNPLWGIKEVPYQYLLKWV